MVNCRESKSRSLTLLPWFRTPLPQTHSWDRGKKVGLEILTSEQKLPMQKIGKS